jgi:hypothetical protein
MPEPSSLMEPHVVPDPTPKHMSMLKADLEQLRGKVNLASAHLSEAARAAQGLAARYAELSAEDLQRYSVPFCPRPAALKEASRAVERLLAEGD